MDISATLLEAIEEIRDLLRIMAEPSMAERDKKLRTELRRIVGNSNAKAKAVALMDGTRTQAVIHKESRVNQGQLSAFIKQLNASKLLCANANEPKLAISLPANFFEVSVEQ